MTTPGPDWVEQARRFAAGLATDLAVEHPGLTGALGGLLGAVRDDEPVGHGAECRSCPLCAGLAALRGRRPDLLEALADVLTGAATALRTTAGTSARADTPDDSGTPGDSGTPPEETVPNPAPAVQRIDVA